MRDIFCGWKRKVGCVSLVIACLFAAFWVRSTLVADFVTLSNNELISLHGVLIGRIAGEGAPGVAAYEAVDLQGPAGHLDYDDEWDWLRWGFGYRSFPVSRMVGGVRSTSTTVDYRIPYGTIVVPLTLASVFLLLAKPKLPKSPTDPPV